MMNEGIKALATLAPALKDPKDALLPGLEVRRLLVFRCRRRLMSFLSQDLRHVSAVVGLAVANQARKEKLSKVERDSDFELEDMQRAQWEAGEWSTLSPRSPLTFRHTTVYRKYEAVDQ